MKSRRSSSFALATLLVLPVAACAVQAAPFSESTGGQKSRDQIADSDDPQSLLPGASTRLRDNISADDLHKKFGTSDATIPYPDTYWPFVDDGIDAKWNGSGTKSPLEKYVSVFNAADAAALSSAQAWEKANHGSGLPGVQGWYGHCPGWTAAAMMNAPIQHAVLAKSDGAGGVTSCSEGDEGCIKFEIGDVNALMAEIYVDARSRFIGNRCDTKPSDIKRDAYGRIVRNGSGCQGLNPGSLVIVLGTQMKSKKKAMAIDAQNDFNTDQIWNQPAYRYEVNRYEAVTASEAANLVAHGTKTGDLTGYKWNDNAKGFVLVDLALSWVSERGANTSVVSGADSTRTTRMVAVLELDGDSANSATKIIGGEYIDDASSGADRLTVPPFVWIASDAGPEDLGTWVNGNHHNPYVKPSLVKKLVEMGQR